MSTKGGRLLRFEGRHQPLLPRTLFRRRLIRHALGGLAVISASLLIGVIGYHVTGGYGWLDSLYNAAMILGGMGPVSGDLEHTPRALKWFASFYALFSGLALLSSAGVLMAPVVHRILHRFHLESGESD